MAKIYVRRINNENIDFTIEDVPLRWRKEVQDILDGVNMEDEEIYG